MHDSNEPLHGVEATQDGWTVWDRGAELGWVRRAEDADPLYLRSPGTYWVIPVAPRRLSDPTEYPSVEAAAEALAVMMGVVVDDLPRLADPLDEPENTRRRRIVIEVYDHIDDDELAEVLDAIHRIGLDGAKVEVQS